MVGMVIVSHSKKLAHEIIELCNEMKKYDFPVINGSGTTGDHLGSDPMIIKEAIEIYDKKTQDTHSGGSGCACSAVTFCGKIFHQLKSKNLNRILFIPTGALMSPTSLQQGENIAGIAHGVIIEN